MRWVFVDENDKRNGSDAVSKRIEIEEWGKKKWRMRSDFSSYRYQMSESARPQTQHTQHTPREKDQIQINSSVFDKVEAEGEKNRSKCTRSVCSRKIIAVLDSRNCFSVPEIFHGHKTQTKCDSVNDDGIFVSVEFAISVCQPQKRRSSHWAHFGFYAD